MKISKTGFINLIRCDRYAALEEIEQKREGSIVTFSENLDDIMSAENLAKTKKLLEDIDEDGQDNDLHFVTMKPYYDKVELLSAKAISKLFKGTLTYSMNTFKQAKYSAHINGYDFYCFLDGILVDGSSISVFESKATTTNKYLKMKADDEPIFIMDENNILRLKKDLGYEVTTKYNEKEKDLFDRYKDVGSYVYDLAFQRYVIENSEGFVEDVNNKYYLAVLNATYEFDGKYDENGEPIYSDDIVAFIDLTRITKEFMPIIEKDINTVIKRLDTMNASVVPIGKHCQHKKTRECKFHDICYKKLPENRSLLNYLDNHHGFKDGNTKLETYDLINEGYLDMLSIPREWMTRNNNIIQREAVESQTPYINKGKIKAGIAQLKYPIYHLDFESFPCPLPRYKGEKPYSQSLFQFSIHIEREPGVCDKDKDHYSFLAKDHEDAREQLILEMLDVIKLDGGSVCVYNISFEKTRIKELGEYFPKYKDRLTDISNRLFDLYYLLRSNGKFYEELGYSKEIAKEINYYHEDLGGSYSIKKVLPLFSNLNYKNLVIQHGEQAYATYALLPTLDEQAYNDSYEAMIEYCKQDTWSMVEILDKLRKTD